MNIMTPGVGVATADIGEHSREYVGGLHIDARATIESHCDASLRRCPCARSGITASQFTLLTQLAQQDGITAVEIGHALDIEKSTLSRNLKRLMALSSHHHGSAGGPAADADCT